MYQALYRKYRPQTFDDVVGQSAVTQTLKTQLQSNKISHAYLFTGSRGTGKTSCAKILAKAVNCEDLQNGNPCNRCSACRAIDSGACMDVLEIDAASNNGVDNVRDLRDDAVYTPSQVKMRVYIIDEVHMLSISAFNALLKIIEEPPEHLLFILATTELHKVPATILSRCQRFAFRRIGQEDIAERLQYVAYQENIDLYDSAARILARLADGGMRDGLSLLDQCASATAGALTDEKVYACLGIAGIHDCGKLMSYIADSNSAAALKLVNTFYAEGKDMAALLDELACLTRDLLILKTAPREGINLLSGVAGDKEAAALCDRFSVAQLTRMMELIQKTAAGFSRSSSRRMDTEICIVTLCRPEMELDAKALNARLSKVEDMLRTGVALKAEMPRQEEKQDRQEHAEPAVAAEEPDVPPVSEAPENFWADLVSALQDYLKPPLMGFITAMPDSPIKGVLDGGVLTLKCLNKFAADMVNKQDILELIAQKTAAILGCRVRIKVADTSAVPAQNDRMQQLLRFGREHADIVSIKE